MNIKELRKSIIGRNTVMQGPYGKRIITYADYTASGQAATPIEDKLNIIKETYANTHTLDSYTGLLTTAYYRQAKRKILRYVGADDNYAVLPIGNGVTGAVHKLLCILGIYEAPMNKKLKNDIKRTLGAQGFSGYLNKLQNIENLMAKKRPVVFITSYEHHSNELMWWEGFCEVVRVRLNEQGRFDLDHLSGLLQSEKYQGRQKIGSFSAASNVTGIITPVYQIAELMHEHDGLVFFDYAASGAYVEINVAQGPASYFDGIYLSTHKFVGGPGSAGLLILRKSVYDKSIPPTCAGGGTVKYVNKTSYYFSDNIEEREDAGTPGILQLIKSALALEIKEKIGSDTIKKIECSYLEQALNRLQSNPNIVLIGPDTATDKLAILSFNVKYKEAFLHHKFITKLLNDLFGIQTRAGCACAGPYGHGLLGIDRERAARYVEVTRVGLESLKPGWVRLNFHYHIDKATFNFLINAIEFVADNAHLFLTDYVLNPATGAWTNKNEQNVIMKLGIDLSRKKSGLTRSIQFISRKHEYKKYLRLARKLATARSIKKPRIKLFEGDQFADIAWFYVRN